MYGNGYGMNYNPYQNGAMQDVLTQYKGQYQPQMPMQMQSAPQMPMQQVPQMPQAQNSGNDRIWVQGEAGAKSYLVAPNTTVVLWDTESPTIYVKSADGTGKPLNMQILDLHERGGTPKEHKCSCGNDFKKMTQEIDSLKEKQTYLENLINSLIPKEEN